MPFDAYAAVETALAGLGVPVRIASNPSTTPAKAAVISKVDESVRQHSLQTMAYLYDMEVELQVQSTENDSVLDALVSSVRQAVTNLPNYFYNSYSVEWAPLEGNKRVATVAFALRHIE